MDTLKDSFGTVQSIETEKLTYRKICVRWILHLLNEDQLAMHREMYAENFVQYQKEGDKFFWQNYGWWQNVVFNLET